MLFRKVIQWTLILLLLIAAGGWYAAQEVWKQKDQLLLEGIRAEVAKKAPDWDMDIEEAHIVNLHGEVRLTNISIKPKGETTAVLHIPECFVTVDPDLLLHQRKVLVRSVRVSNPIVTLIRHNDGGWNWQKLGRPTPSDQTPEIKIEHGTFIVRVEATIGLPETEIVSRDVALSLLPSGQHRYLIEGATQIEGAGHLAFAGKVDLNSGAWELGGKADGLDMSPALLEKAAALSPALKRQVAELSQQGVTIAPGASSALPHVAREDVFQPVSQTRTVLGASSQLSLPNLGLIANVGIDFALRSDGQQPIPEYRVLVKIMDGQVTEPLSPVPLSGLEGELLIKNDHVIINQVSAANGESKLFLKGEVRKQGDETVIVFEVAATNLWLDHEIRNVLPPEGKKLFDLINPSGLFTVEARYDSQAAKPLQLDRFQAHNCRIQHALFPYPVTQIVGTVDQQGEQLNIDLKGIAADRPVKINGIVKNPGPNAETILQVQVDDFPLDQRFTDAIVAEKHQAVRRAIESLNLTGLADFRVQFTREGRLGEKFQMSLDADVKQASLSYDRFPYGITNLSGHVHHNPLKEKVWRFTDLQGRHGSTAIAGQATFEFTQRPGRLTLNVNARDALLDQDLRDATITANPNLEAAWTELNPSGIIHVDGLVLTWVPGSSPRVVLPSIQLDRGTILLNSFPFRWDRVTADLAWRDGRIDLHLAEGYHNETRVVIDGRTEEHAAFFEIPDNQRHRWRLRLPNVSVTNLDPGPELRAALPPETAAVVETLDPRGPLDLDLGLEILSFPQSHTDDLLTSHLQLKRVTFEKDRLFAGLELTDVTGDVTADIIWDGEQVTGDGWIDFERARTLDMTCTNLRGPFSVEGTRIVAGSELVLRAPPPGQSRPKVPSDEQITASIYHGSVIVNAIVQIDLNDADRSVYQAQVDLKNADLQLWTDEWWPQTMNVTGTVNGQMNLNGRGTSPLALQGQNCWMQITDAQLGELPVMAQVMGQLVQPQMRNVDKTAFRYAYTEFSVANGRFEFGLPGRQDRRDTRRIQLDGSVLKMVGQGFIPFAPGVDPRMSLDFYSKVSNPGNPVMSLPFVNQLSRAFSDNWIHVQVTGTPSQPQVRTMPNVPIGNANEVLRGFVTALESGLAPVLPRPVSSPSRPF